MLSRTTARALPAARRAPRTADAGTTWSPKWTFATFAIASWIFAPFLRRFIDWRTGGFHAIDILSLVPLASLLPFVRFSYERATFQRVPKPFKVFFTVWTGSLVYGLAVAAINGNIGGGLFEFAQCELPAVYGFWLSGQDLSGESAARRIGAVLLPMAALAGLYGIVQWISPAPWDAQWIEESGLTNMGQPVPFNLRIFATLNSVGPAADFFALCLLFALPNLRVRNFINLFTLPILSAALMLTLVRAAWIGLAIGVLTYLFTAPQRLRIVVVIVFGTIFAAALASSLPTLLGDSYDAGSILGRFQTLGDVEHDLSANTREGEYYDAIDAAAKAPLGLGLGTFGPGARLSGAVDIDQNGRVIDGGYLANLLSLGWVDFCFYLGVTIGAPLWLLAASIRHRQVESATVVALAVSVGVYLIWNDSAVESHIATDGLLFWIATSLAFRAIEDAKGVAANAAAPVARPVLPGA
jgi:hypothetical protein